MDFSHFDCRLPILVNQGLIGLIDLDFGRIRLDWGLLDW